LEAIVQAKYIPNDDDPDALIWGAADIAKAANLKNRRQAFHLLERGIIPAKKAGKQWVTTLRKIRSVAHEAER
jgi:hypothetical protein